MVGRRSTGLICLLLVLLMVGLSAGCGGGTGETANSPGLSSGDAEIKTDELLAKSKNLPGLSYDSVMTASGQEISSKVWVKEGNMRIEMDLPDNAGKMVSIVNSAEKAVYSYSPGQETATKMALEMSEVDTTSPQDYSQNIKPESMKYVKTATLDGKECLVYKLDDPDFQGEMWLWREYGIPLRVEATAEGGTMLVEYRNAQVGELEDDLFNLPEGMTVMDLGNL